MSDTPITGSRKHELKLQAARAALEFIHDDQLVGIGTGTTVNCFIDVLAASGLKIRSTVSSSETSSVRLRAHGLPVCDMNDYEKPQIYIDGADEVDPQLRLIKGGGGALTREKILAEASPIFVCIAEQSKQVEMLGKFPLPIEVIPAARRLVTETITSLATTVKKRHSFVTDNGNIILDVQGLPFTNPLDLERRLSMIPGVVTVGVFAHRRADILLLGTDFGIKKYMVPTRMDSRPQHFLETGRRRDCLTKN